MHMLNYCDNRDNNQHYRDRRISVIAQPYHHSAIIPWPALIRIKIFSCKYLSITNGQACEIKCCQHLILQVFLPATKTCYTVL